LIWIQTLTSFVLELDYWTTYFGLCSSKSLSSNILVPMRYRFSASNLFNQPYNAAIALRSLRINGPSDGISNVTPLGKKVG
jgi:hypothetical protein